MVGGGFVLNFKNERACVIQFTVGPTPSQNLFCRGRAMQTGAEVGREASSDLGESQLLW